MAQGEAPVEFTGVTFYAPSHLSAATAYDSPCVPEVYSQGRGLARGKTLTAQVLGPRPEAPVPVTQTWI